MTQLPHPTPMSYEEGHAIETFKSLITVSVEGLKTLLLINGGAIVAILAFLGQSQLGATLAPRLSLSVLLFVIGVVTGTLGFGASYKTQYALLNEHFPARQYQGWRHQSWLRVSFGLALLSIISFASGALLALAAFSESQAKPSQSGTSPPHAAASATTSATASTASATSTASAASVASAAAPAIGASK